jgi:hypothetical protein
VACIALDTAAAAAAITATDVLAMQATLCSAGNVQDEYCKQYGPTLLASGQQVVKQFEHAGRV